VAQLAENKKLNEEVLETELIQRAIQLDTAAYSELYDLNVGKVFRHVHYRVCDKKNAEDIAQDVFVRGWKAISKYKKTGAPFGAWLFAIADNLIADYFRKRKNRTLSLEEAVLVDAPVSDPVETAEANLRDTSVRMAIWKLKGEKQKVILLRFIAGYSCFEIARLLKKSEGAIRIIQFRALKDLRRLLHKEYEE
jgi:RNA polymerase sigma-70 factor (ECF subfamily)